VTDDINEFITVEVSGTAIQVDISDPDNEAKLKKLYEEYKDINSRIIECKQEHIKVMGKLMKEQIDIEFKILDMTNPK